MERLPILSGRDMVKSFSKLGYVVEHMRGSHMRLVCDGRKSITVPDYKTIGRGLLRKILRDAELTPMQFIKLL